MKYLITESQYGFLRRYNQIKNLVDRGIETLRNDVDICDYTFTEFLTEVSWQVSDNMDENTPIGTTHKWVWDNFKDEIRPKFDELIELEGCNDYSDEDVDDDDWSSHFYGIDNNQ